MNPSYLDFRQTEEVTYPTLTSISIDDLNKLLEIENLKVYPNWVEYIKPLISSKSFIAGGCFKDFFDNKKPRDIDVFFNDEDEYKKYYNIFDKSSQHKVLYNNNNSVAFESLKNPGWVVNLIKCKFGTPHEILSTFDYTVSMFALYLDSVYNSPFVTYHDNYFTDLTNKKLSIPEFANLDKSKTPGLFNRMIKYTKYGFIPTQQCKIRILNAIKAYDGKWYFNSNS